MHFCQTISGRYKFNKENNKYNFCWFSINLYLLYLLFSFSNCMRMPAKV